MKLIDFRNDKNSKYHKYKDLHFFVEYEQQLDNIIIKIFDINYEGNYKKRY